MAVKQNALFIKIFEVMAHDQRISVWHFRIYMCVYYHWLIGGMVNPISISRKQIMAYTRIGSIVTYHKCIQQLQEFGYIIYEPNFNPFKGSNFSLLIPGHKHTATSQPFHRPIFILPK